MQMLLNGGDRQNALMRIFQLQPRLLRLDGSRLHEKDAGDDLQAVCDTVLYFVQQHVLFLHQILHLPLYGAPLGNVLECQQDSGFSSGLIEHCARVQRHDASSDSGKLTVDFILLNSRVIRRDRFQQLTKLWYVPMTVFDLIKQMATNILTGELKDLIEGAARSGDALIPVEHQERVANGINNRMRERQRDPLWNVSEW